MNSKVSFSRAVLRGTAVALALAAGLASTTLAIGQGAQPGQPSADLTRPFDLARQLANAQSKAQVVALLNAASQAGLTKTGIIQALSLAQGLTRNFQMMAILSNIQGLVVASAVEDGGAGTATFVDNGGATGSTFFVAGNNAASGSVIDTSDVDGGFQSFQNVIRVGPYAA